jgi:LruC domain-containing protein
MKNKLFILIFLLGLGFLFVSCNKDKNNKTETPLEFLDLKVDKAFKFENYANVETSIRLGTVKAGSVEIVQIYDAHPSNGGKLILTGSVNQDGVFNLPLRIPSRLKEVYVAKLSSTGVNEYVAVPVSGNTLQYNFASAKSVESVTPCDEGCTQTVQGTNNNLVVASGEMVCVSAGTSATFNSLQINDGGILRVCGTAVINSYKNGGGTGTLIVMMDGTTSLPKYNNDWSIENYGQLNFTGSGTMQLNGDLLNYGSVSSGVTITVQGTVNNNGTFTTSKALTINPDATFINQCQLMINYESNNAFQQNSYFTNNGYVYVKGSANFSGSGNKVATLGVGSLIDTKFFKIEGIVVGPDSQGAQITGKEDCQTSSGSSITGYVDLWVKNGNEISPDNATKGPNVTEHAYTISAPTCSSNTAPNITSSLQIGAFNNQAITPYVITATGTESISYSVSGLPDGLTFNPANHTISGAPTTNGTYNVELTATNFMGSDTKTLVIIVSDPPSAPVITSSLVADATVDQSFSYLFTASGSPTIIYNVSNLPDGLTFDPETQIISGNPTAAGTFNIQLYATNGVGTANEILILTVGSPPTITSTLTANGQVDVQFTTYVLTADGTPEMDYQVSNLPQGLLFDEQSHSINGTPTFPGVFDVLLMATNAYGTDVKTLVITIAEGTYPPDITSQLTDVAQKNQPYSYSILADGTQPIEFNATNLPAGLTFSGNVISGIPIVVGTFDITLTATNVAGTDTKTLVLTIAIGSASDADGDDIPDNLDEYPNDPDRAFNSYYPNETDFGSVAFEDLWPGYGDYDFNDFVANFNYKTVTNAQNEVVDIVAKYQIMADGASMDNGFGIVLNTAPSNIESVTGYVRFGNSTITDPAGYEVGHENETVIIVYDAINPIMDGGMANTIPDGKYIQTTVNTINIHFSIPQAGIGQAPYNPFIYVDQERGREVHLKDQSPTESVNPEYFGSYSDASEPGSGLYYRSVNGLPWAVEIPVSFDYPVELVDILDTHLKFANWAQSSGQDFPDWYMDLEGYRNVENIYVIPVQE